MEERPNLKTLYPFLHGKAKDSRSENAALLESINQKVREGLDIKSVFFQESAQAVIDAAQSIADVYKSGKRMFSMGNGGSSCDAAHFAVEFQHPVTAGRPALPAINLTMDAAMVSAVANDVGVDYIFARQLEALAQEGDGLIGFSTSGNSRNLIEAFRKAREMRLISIGMAGGDGGLMLSSGLLDHCLIVETDSIHRIQETHVATYHIIWDLVHTLLADNRGKLSKRLTT
jgi:D-sedoheptulose 7-phosphate isomerase